MYIRKTEDGYIIAFQVKITVPAEGELAKTVASLVQEIDVNLSELCAQMTTPFATQNGYTEASIDSKGILRLKKAANQQEGDN